MARSKISAANKSIINDDGAILVSVAKGEQFHIEITANWLSNMDGYAVKATLIEAQNDGSGTIPTDVKTNGTTRQLTIANGLIREANDGNNRFKVVIPYDACVGAIPQPAPNKSIFMFIDLEIGEPGTDTGATPDKQIWKPLRGLIEFMYSPTEA